MHLDATYLYILMVRSIALFFVIEFYGREKSEYHLLLVQGWTIYALSVVFRLVENQSDYIMLLSLLTAVIGMYLIIAGALYVFVSIDKKKLYYFLSGIGALLIGASIFDIYIAQMLTFYLQGITLFATLVFFIYKRSTVVLKTREAAIWLYMGLGISNLILITHLVELMTKNDFGDFNKVGTLMSSSTLCIYFILLELVAREKELKISEERYRTITEISMDGYLVVDKNGRILENNNALHSITGFSKDRLQNLKIQEMVPPGMEKQIESQMQRVIQNGHGQFKSKLLREDGTVIDIQNNIVYSIAEGVFLGFVSDITEQEKSQKALEESKQKYSSYVENAPVGIFITDNNGRYVETNPNASIITGYSEKELLQMSITGLIPEKTQEEGRAHFGKVLAEGINFGEASQYRKKDGTVGWWIVNAVKLSEHRILGIAKDVTDIKNTEEKLKKSEKRLLTAQSIAHVGDWELDLKTSTMWASEEAFNIYGLEQVTEYLSLDEVMAAASSEYRQLLNESLSDLIAMDKEYNVEFKIIKKNTGKECYIHSIGILARDEKGNPRKVIGTIQDITEQRKKEEILQYLSYHDQLTGLHNRRFYEEELFRLDTARNLPLTIVLCDVNGLKLINDSFGHTVGDELLKKAAAAIKFCCRADDIIARHGGDEFVVLLPKTSNLEAESILQRIKEEIEKGKVGGVDISISMGYETKAIEEEDVQTIFKRAEDHMYRHKLYESGSARSKTIDLIINTLYEKNNREMLHSKRVSKLCEAIAQEYGMNPDDVNQVRMAGLMHDVGKIGIDENILNKIEALTDAEWQALKKHSEIGYRILSSVNEFSEISEFVLEHQEKWDGTGYPKGLKGAEISTEARIIAVADAYDAMTGKRTYRKSLTKEEAVMEIKRCAGTQFDPEIARIFVEEVLLNL